ncbi:toprim domain protein, partial [Escherichia coli 95.0183]
GSRPERAAPFTL